MKSHPGNTNTNDALYYCYYYFEEQMKLRPNSQRVLIILTDGNPTYPIYPGNIQRLQDLNVNRYAVGVGTGINTDVLISISGSSPTDTSRVYQISAFTQYNQILYSLSSTSCSTPAILSSTTQSNVTVGAGTSYYSVGNSSIAIQAKVTSQLDQNLSDLIMSYSYTYDIPNENLNTGFTTFKDQLATVYLRANFTNNGKLLQLYSYSLLLIEKPKCKSS